MSRLFGVTTDYLLKDEIEAAEPTVNEDDHQPPLRRVTIGEASDYLALRRAAAPRIALATMLCIFSPIALIGLAAVSEPFGFSISPAGGDGSRYRAVRAAGSGRHCGGAVYGLRK